MARCPVVIGVWIAGVWAVGCGCPRFDEMVVSDPGGLGRAVDRQTVHRAIADFERWTGEVGVCVPAVEFVEEIDGGRFSGRYRGPRNAIEQLPDAGYSITIHELCHAADHQLGWISNDRPELFPVGHVDPVGYPTRYSQEHESLARICQFGPQGLDLQRLVEDRCGLSLKHPGQDLVLNQIYGAARIPEGGVPPGRLSLDMVRLSALVGDEAVLDVASGENWVWVLTLRDAGAPVAERLEPALTPQTMRLTAVDPVTLRVVSVAVLAREVDGDRAPLVQLVDADGEAALLLDTLGANATTVWTLDERTLLPSSPVVLSGRVGEGLDRLLAARVDGDLVVYQGLQTDGFPAIDSVESDWLVVDPQTGDHYREHPLLDYLRDPPRGGRLRWVAAGGEGVQLGLEGPPRLEYLGPPDQQASAALVAQWSSSTGRARVTDVVRALFRRSLGTLAGGEVLGQWGDADAADGLDPARGMVALDPQTGRWYLPDDLCASDAVFFGARRVMHAGGTTVVFADGTAGPVLVRVDTED